MIAAKFVEPSLMISEIAESGDAIGRQLVANAEATKRCAAELRARNPQLVATIARGSSDHCALYLKYLLEILVGVPCASIGPSIASLYNAQLRLEGALGLAISQ